MILFESLFKSNKWTWLFGWMFHAALLLALVRHLRDVTEPAWGWVTLLQPIGIYAGFAVLAGLAGLWLRRLMVARIRYVPGPSDHPMLLLGGIAASGLAMRYLVRTDIVALKAFILGLIYVDWRPLPADPVLLLHLGLVVALMIVFPFSKLLHAPGVFFSPSRNQVDNTREKHYLAPWSAGLESTGELTWRISTSPSSPNTRRSRASPKAPGGTRSLSRRRRHTRRRSTFPVSWSMAGGTRRWRNSARSWTDPGRCEFTWTPASNVAPAPTSATTSWAPAIPRTCRPRARDLRSAIARDVAFGFYYPDDIEAFAAAGAELVPFDALADPCPPEVDGLFIGGGFPECAMAALSANGRLRASIKAALEAGMPAYAECGGLMYLARSLSWRGETHEMVGAIPGDAVMNARPRGRGYMRLEETGAGLWPLGSAAGGGVPARFPAHEFHYASLENLPGDLRYAYRVLRGAGVDGRHDGTIFLVPGRSLRHGDGRTQGRSRGDAIWIWYGLR